MSLNKAIWVREMRGQEPFADRPMKVTLGKVAHLLDPSSPLVEPRDPYMRIGAPKRTLCGVVVLTIYSVPDSFNANRCRRCLHIAQTGSR